MSTHTAQPIVDPLKAKHRTMWASGNYAAVAREVVPALGPALVGATGIACGDRVLDIAAGSGNASIAAAQVGARVDASDLTPELLEVGRREAERLGLVIEWQTADAEALPYADGEFDAAISCVGIMFAPHHQAAADELIRVTRPGGRIGLVNWTPEGFIGQMFTTMKPHTAAPPPGVQPPPLWGTENHVADLLGDRVTDFHAERAVLRVDVFPNATTFRDYFKRNYGPTLMTYRGLADDPQRATALDRALVDLADRHNLGDGVMEWEYLLVTARVRR